MKPRSRSALLALALALLALPLRRPAAQGVTDLGKVTPSDFKPSIVAVPPFEPTGEAVRDPFSEIIERDLFLSGFFQGPNSPELAAETHAADKRENKIHYADWQRQKIAYVIKGEFKMAGDKVIEVKFRTYDTTYGKYIFGKLYQETPKSRLRDLAHRVSNDIIQRITGVQGCAHTQILCVGEVGGGPKGTKEIFVLDADGENRRQLTKDHNLDATPAWGARGTEVYYTTYKDYNPDLAGVYLDGSHSWFVSRRAGFNLSPCWCEKNQLMALTLSKDGNSEIYTMDRGGKDLKRLTFNRAIDSSPVWSPDGTQIAFTSDRGGGPQIYIMDASGVSVRQLTHSGSYNDGAAWSPRNDVIAYSARINGIFQVFTIGLNGENNRQLTFADYDSEDPCFSANGWVILYTSTKTGTKQLYTMFMDGRPLAQLTKGSANYSSAWSPMLP